MNHGRGAFSSRDSSAVGVLSRSTQRFLHSSASDSAWATSFRYYQSDAPPIVVLAAGDTTARRAVNKGRQHCISS
jgi:hypothetical protein